MLLHLRLRRAHRRISVNEWCHNSIKVYAQRKDVMQYAEFQCVLEVGGYSAFELVDGGVHILRRDMIESNVSPQVVKMGNTEGEICDWRTMHPLMF